MQLPQRNPRCLQSKVVGQLVWDGAFATVLGEWVLHESVRQIAKRRYDGGLNISVVRAFDLDGLDKPPALESFAYRATKAARLGH